MIAIEDVEPDLKVLCENLVFNKCPEATEMMLDRTTWEKEAIEAKKKGLSLRRKPRVVIQYPKKTIFLR